MVLEEIIGALKKMKGCKAAAMDGVVVEILKNGGISIIDLLLRIFNKCMGYRKIEELEIPESKN